METDSMEAAVQSLLVQPEAPPDDQETDLPDEEEAPVAEEEPTDDAEVVEEASEDEAEDAEAPEEPQLYTVKVDGEERRVTLEELTRDYSGQASIQRRIQEAEVARKQAHAAADAFQREFQSLQAFHAQVRATGFMPPPQPPNPALAQQNPAAYVKALADYQGRAHAFQSQQAHLQRAQAAQQQAQRAALESRLAQESARLAELIPDFAKPETAAKARDRLVRAGQDYGFDAQELDGITDARMVQVLHDAARFRDLQARQREARKPTPTPRHVAPAAAKRPEPPHLAHANQVKRAIAKGPIRAADAASLLLVPQPRRK